MQTSSYICQKDQCVGDLGTPYGVFLDCHDLIMNVVIYQLMLKIANILKNINPLFKSIHRFNTLGPNFLKPSASLSRANQIVSLTNQQVDQLSKITHYNTSVDLLSKNQLEKSLTYLNYSLTEAKSQYPWSINLHSCLMNRMSILMKLLGKNGHFCNTLEELFLVSLSSKGINNLQTQKNLTNYLTSLLIFNRQKAQTVLEFLEQSQKNLPQYLHFFKGIISILQQKKYREGIQKLMKLPENHSYEKCFKENNVSWMKTICLRQQYKEQAQYSRKLKQGKGDQILDGFLKALIVAEENPQEGIEYSQQQTKQLEDFIKSLKTYLTTKKHPIVPSHLSKKTKLLKSPNSHIISMNISSHLFSMQHYSESFYFAQLSLEKALSQNQLQRIGLSLILIGKYYYRQSVGKWQKLYLDMLTNANRYPRHIMREVLKEYSNILIKQGRLVQADSYYRQAQQIQNDGSMIQGLILPSYDFSF